MIFKNFRLNVIFRVVVITTSIFLFYYSFSTHYVFTPVIVGILIVYLIFSLIRYIEKTNRELTSFLESIRYSEFSRSVNLNGLGASFNELNTAFNEVLNDFQKVRNEKEEHFFYLQTILQNIDVSVIAYRADGTIELINKAAKKLFQVSGLRNIQGLETLSKELVQVLFSIKPGQSELVKVQDDNDFLQLAIYATNFKIKNQLITLTTIKDIQNVLEEQETEAWQKLIRVMTHEIMNSIAPISSIATTLSENTLRINPDESGQITFGKEDIEELQQAILTISKRSNGLLHFVNTYRNLTKIPQPNFAICNVKDVLKNVTGLLDEEFKRNKIEIAVKAEPENISITADGQLIEQVIINIIKNSIQALTGRPNSKIQLVSFYNKRGRTTIQITDNGPGILPDVIDKIFIPFFTTKPNGSGIGLALSRQILKLHNGSLTAQSNPEVETTFTLTF